MRFNETWGRRRRSIRSSRRPSSCSPRGRDVRAGLTHQVSHGKRALDKPPAAPKNEVNGTAWRRCAVRAVRRTGVSIGLLQLVSRPGIESRYRDAAEPDLGLERRGANHILEDRRHALESCLPGDLSGDLHGVRVRTVFTVVYSVALLWDTH